jgi:hypothetical protein
MKMNAARPRWPAAAQLTVKKAHAVPASGADTRTGCGFPPYSLLPIIYTISTKGEYSEGGGETKPFSIIIFGQPIEFGQCCQLFARNFVLYKKNEKK